MTVASQSSRSAEVAAQDLVTLTIDDIDVTVPKGTLVIRAAELIGTAIPRFCDHPLLEPVGACRQCLVEITDAGNGRGMPKPAASCTIEVAQGMVVKTQVTSPVAEKAQNGNLEFLLINHPLDCPVCDKGGECPLQNQAMSHGYGESRYVETKRTFPKPLAISPQVLLDRERCVLCARCTRFSEQIAGDPFIEMLERGALQQVGIYENEPFSSYFSGNTVQICPVGALTSADYRFRARPFDLIATPGVAEHDSSCSAIRIDHRRGKVMRRLAADDPAVNSEWISDKDRFAFTYARQSDRLTRPLVRDAETGNLEPASWLAALAAAARGLAAAESAVGVLAGGRLTAEDAYAYSKFARTVVHTNDVDFRARPHSEEEAEFLAAGVAATHLTVTFADLEKAKRVVLVGFEPEDENGVVFLRLRKAALAGTEVVAIASHATRGLHKMNGELIQTLPGSEAEAINALDLDGDTVMLVGERLAAVQGALSAALAVADRTGAKLAWIPRRAGERGAVEVGCLPNLLPGGRPVTDPSARADLSAAWGVKSVPAKKGRDTGGILGAAESGKLGALIVGGVELSDLPQPAQARSALAAVGFLVSLEVRQSAITEMADVVLPVAPVAEKSGRFVNWEGRTREFGQVFDVPGSLTDTRVLAGISEEMGSPLGFRTTEQVRAEIAEIGTWDGDRAAPPTTAASPIKLKKGQVLLETWRLMIDDSRCSDGQPDYKATARPARLLANAQTLTEVGAEAGGRVSIVNGRGALAFDCEVADLPDRVVWVPTNSAGLSLRHFLGIGHGDAVTLRSGEE